MGVFQNNLMGAAAAASAGGGGTIYSHQIANSCRFVTATPSYMYRTQGTPTNVEICTVSAWVKRGLMATPIKAFTGSGYNDGSFAAYGFICFELENATTLTVINDSGTPGPFFKTTNVYRDPSAWYHIVVAMDTTQAVAANRTKIYVNGVQPTSFSIETQPPVNQDIYLNASGHKLFVGSGGDSAGNSTYPYDGLIAEYVFIDGTQYAASDFGETVNGVWQPKDPSGLTFGNNGCYLKFESSSDLGNDSSGNNNDFTVSGLAAHDQMLDSPTFSSTDGNGGNFCTWNPLAQGSYSVLSEGNLKHASNTSADAGYTGGTMGATSGKWYWETYIGSLNESWPNVGITDLADIAFNHLTLGQNYFAVRYRYNGAIESSNYANMGTMTIVATGAPTYTTGDIIGIHLDCDNKKLWFSKNGTQINSGDPSAGTNYQAIWTANNNFELSPYSAAYQSYYSILNCGQEGTFAGAITAGGNADENGYGNFKYAPDTGFLAICSGNLPTADAVDPAQTDDNYPQKLFAPKLYTGDGATTLTISGMDFQPDWTWIKNRDAADSHCLFDSNRGVTKLLSSDTTDAETTDADTLKSWTSDGYTVGADVKVNTSSEDYASWNWRVNGGTTSSNSNGSQNATTVQVDPSGGFSIATWLGSGTTGTLGHGLSSAPTFYVVRDRDNGNNWPVYAKGAGATKYAILDGTAAFATAAMWNNTAPTSTVFSVTTNTETNGSGRNYVGYFFADVEGYIKSGSYEGNGNADGTFVYTGFRPAWIMCKSIDSTSSWQLFDNKRLGYNVDNNELVVEAATAEATTDMIDILSNGFKLRIATDPNVAETYVYLAMAENPFKYATAR